MVKLVGGGSVINGATHSSLFSHIFQIKRRIYVNLFTSLNSVIKMLYSFP